jgi:hypothetical protein
MRLITVRPWLTAAKTVQPAVQYGKRPASERAFRFQIATAQLSFTVLQRRNSH